MNKKQLIVAWVMVFSILASSAQAILQVTSIRPNLFIRHPPKLVKENISNSLKIITEKVSQQEHLTQADGDAILAIIEMGKVSPEEKERINKEALLIFSIAMVTIICAGGLLLYVLGDKKK